MEKQSDHDQSLQAKVQLVLEGLREEAPLSEDEAAYCDEACVLRFLRSRSGNVAKATKLLRSTLKWRSEFEVSSLNINEFADNISVGNMFTAGRDPQGHPILMTRKKAERILPGQHQKYLRFLVFTLESCISSMPHGVEQWVWIMDLAGYSRANSPPLNVSLATLNILADHYPERLAKCFIVDAPSIFYFLWKALSPFVDAATRTKIEFVYTKKIAACQEELAASTHGVEADPQPSISPQEEQNAASIGEVTSAKSVVGPFEDYIRFWKAPYDEAAYRAFLGK